MHEVDVVEKEIYCKRINGKLVCYQVVKAEGNAIRLKNIDGIQPEFATTAEKLVKSQYVRREVLPAAAPLAPPAAESPGIASQH